MAPDSTLTPGQPQDRAMRVVMGGMLTGRQMGALIAYKRAYDAAGALHTLYEPMQTGKHLLFARWLADHDRIGG